MSQVRTKSWQVRLPKDENDQVDRLAAKRAMSKNDLVRQGLRLLVVVDGLTTGERLLIERRGKGQRREAVEVWLV